MSEYPELNFLYISVKLLEKLHHVKNNPAV